ncbi:MAG: nuclear transport factor 2 family protein [Cyanobacteria bacterium J06598_1]
MRCLEEELWQSETCFDKQHMNELFADDFFEFGRSGRIYERKNVLDAAPQTLTATSTSS